MRRSGTRTPRTCSRPSYLRARRGSPDARDRPEADDPWYEGWSYAIGLAGIALIGITAGCGGGVLAGAQPSVPVGADRVARAVLVGREGLELKAKGIKCTINASPGFEAYDCTGFSMREDLDPRIRCNVRQHILADENGVDEPDTTFFFCQRDADDLGHLETCVLQTNRRVYVREERVDDLTYPDRPYETSTDGDPAPPVTTADELS